MRFIILLGALMVSLSASAEVVIPTDCDVKLATAEMVGQTTVYDECGFNDAQTAWNKWAGWVSQKQYKRALYELCVRYPAHPYSDLYCEKSANLGYAPAVAEQGHRLMDKGLSKPAVEHYTRALQTRSLSDEQEGQVAERLGLYYLDETGGAYAPAKGVVFLTEASKKRSAAANNMMGYLSYSGDFGVRKSEKEAFKYIWRAILLGCPAAEENLGLFHLSKSKELKYETVLKYMKNNAYSCQSGGDKTDEADFVKPAGCVCEQAFKMRDRHKNKPYYLTGVVGDKAVLRDHDGVVQRVQLKQKLSDGYFVTDIRPTAVILEKAGERVVLNLMSNMDCLDFCEKIVLKDGTVEDVKIKPYRLTFTPQECRHLMHYAPELVDTSKPYVGKTECVSPADVADDALLRLMQNDEPSVDDVVSNPVSLEQPVTRGVRGQIGVVTDKKRGTSEKTQVGAIKQPKVPAKHIKKSVVHHPKKEIRFTVGGGGNQKDDKK